MKKKVVVTLFIVIVLLVIGYLGVGNYFYNLALHANNDKEFLQGNPHLQASVEVDANVIESAELKDEEFKEEHPPSQVTVKSRDDLKLNLHADEYENGEDNQKWVIVVHGYTSQAAHMTRWIRNFYDQGFNVLAPDLRGHGDSEGDYIGMGWHDRLDLLVWIDKIIDVNPDAQIVLFGVSMGGATVMMTSGEELPPNVKVIVEDCGYSSVQDVFSYQLDDLFGLPEFPVMNAANTITRARAGYDLKEASAVHQIKKSKTPMLFIHGDDDSFVPFNMLDEVYNAATVEKEKLVIEGAGHGEAVMANPELYWSTIWDFLGKYVEIQ